MTKTGKTALLHIAVTYTVVLGSIASIGAHMWLVYMGGQHMSLARQTEEKIYDVRGEIVHLASAGAENLDMQNVVASHLVIAEPMTVSVSR